MKRRAYLEIDLSAIEWNFKCLSQKLNQEKFICPMVKDNGYGHGLIETAQALEQAGATQLGVARVEEGLDLRKNNIRSQILVFGDTLSADYIELLNLQLTPVVSSWRQLSDLSAAVKKTQVEKNKTSLSVHLKFDTGMNRLGFSMEDIPRLNEFLQKNKFYFFEGLLTHLACAEDALNINSKTRKQLSEFQKIQNQFSLSPRWIHSLNSAAIFNKINSSSQSYLNKTNWGLRPGLMIYGVPPFKMKNPKNKFIELKSAMSLKSTAALIRKIKKGESVSYGATWKASRDSLIAVVPLGYGDGFPRRLSNKCWAWMEGIKCPQVGNICMDLLMFDITPLGKKFSIESLYEKEMTLLGHDAHGNEISASTLAQTLGTIPWEILVGFQERFPRVYKKEEKRDKNNCNIR